MKFKDFKIAWRLLVKEPSYSAIVILGLSVAIAMCFLLLGLVKHQLSFDQDLPDNDQLYFVKTHYKTDAVPHWVPGASIGARQAVRDSGLPVQASIFSIIGFDMQVENQVQNINTAYVDADFISMFGLHAIEGNLLSAMTEPDAITLTEAASIKLFGKKNGLGKTVLVDRKPYRVTAIVASPAVNSSLQYEALCGLPNTMWDKDGGGALTNFGTVYGNVYLKIPKHIAPTLVANAIFSGLEKSAFYNQYVRPLLAKNLNGRDLIIYHVTPLRRQNIDPDIHADLSRNPFVLAAFVAIALILLLLATTNYLNLATVRVIQRQREIGLHKVLGASTTRLLQHFLSESILVALIAGIIGLVFAWLLLPVFSEMMNVDLGRIFSVTSIAMSVGLSVVLGLLAGVYPAWVALKVRPSAALAGRGNQESSQGAVLRRMLTLLQFTVAMGLVATALAVSWQTHYFMDATLGFDPNSIITVSVPENFKNANTRAFRDEVARIPGVETIGVTSDRIRDMRNWDDVKREGTAPTNIAKMRVNADFFKAYRLPLLAGRIYDITLDEVDKTDKRVISASTVKALGFSSNEAAIGQAVIASGNPVQIIGVVGDVRNSNPTHGKQTAMYVLSSSVSHLAIRFNGNKVKIQNDIAALWEKFYPSSVNNISTMQAQFYEAQADSLHTASLLNIASTVTIIIAAFGIYVLAAYSVQRRSKEIILRKLMGASSLIIARLVLKEFALLMGGAALLALPIAYVIIQKYLADVVDPAPIGIWTLVAAFVIACTVAILSTLRHTLSAMHLRPVQILRD